MTDFGLGLVVFVVILLLLVMIKGFSLLTAALDARAERIAAAINGTPIVNRYLSADADVMSNADFTNDDKSLSSHRPDLRPRDETPARPKATDEQFLTLFAVFKEAGYSREEARSILRPFGVPVDNNLYSRAPKPPEPMGGDPRIKVPPYQRPPQTADELA